MKYIVSVLILVLGVFFTQGAKANEYKEGVHYTVFEGAEKSEKPKLTEFFSIYCPHCYSFEKSVLPSVLPLIGDTEFERVHVNFVGGYSKNHQRAVTMGYVLSKEKGVEKHFVDSMFESIQGKNVKVNTKQKLTDAMVGSGINKETASDIVGLKVKYAEAVEMENKQEKYVNGGAVSGVPTFIVNDVYVLNFSALDKKDPLVDMAKLINYLSKK